MKISQITRQDIFDAILVENVNWAGRLDEPAFLSRLFDLTKLPSIDPKFKDAADDIWQHCVNNPNDWEDNWIFDDSRFDLLNCDDEILLQFLCETIHPIVRSDVTEAERLCQLYNSFLEKDGYRLVERARISGKPVFAGRYIGVFGAPGISAAKETLSGSDESYVLQQITRMEASIDADPDLAIGTAKDLIETCCKTILQDRNIEFSKKSDISKLVKATSKELKLTPDDIADEAKAADTIKSLLGNLAAISQGIAELRNRYGSGHGRTADTKGLSPRHAKLAVGAASTLAVFLVETHNARGTDS